MTSRMVFTLALAASLGTGGPARPDVWDSSTVNDNSGGTTNEITHGFSQVHDLGAQPGPVPDEDSGFPNTLHLVTGAGSEVLPSFQYAFGYARSLRFANNNPTTNVNEFVRVFNAACGANCGTNDNYRIRAWDTTIAVPRYNNFGGQVTVLIIQNPAEDTVVGTVYLWTSTGGTVPVTTSGFILPARQSVALNLATINGGAANGTAGTITITHNGRYGQLAVKSVALEPATGFSFDSPGLYKPAS